MISVELLFPNGDSLSYIKMSKIPRIGESFMFYENDDEIAVNYVIKDVSWIVDLTQADDDQSNCVQLVLERKQ